MFALLAWKSSKLEQEEISKWVYVIVDCIKYFESMVDVSSLDDVSSTRLSHACAVYAYYKYSLYELVSSESKFKAGDVEITQSENIADRAHIMWQQHPPGADRHHAVTAGLDAEERYAGWKPFVESGRGFPPGVFRHCPCVRNECDFYHVYSARFSGFSQVRANRIKN